MSYRINAIPTMRNGIMFRSRLEAKWSAFFDAAGWRWSYEPIDLDGWIPDFVLHFHRPVLVEVKPALSEAELYEHTAKIDAARPRHDAILVGADVGLVKDEDYFKSVTIGLLGEFYEEHSSLAWGPATAFICGKCSTPSFAHAINSYDCRVCGKGSAHRTAYAVHWPEVDMRRAQNETQWRRPS